ncbi:glycosyltransferase [Rhodococcus sp. Z13]|uniref:Glycosyltransferase n=1 Tax=Rhodococcus sacchari TaxID=2962047 RepID=A0ACD4DIW0_9NOCA|nr:glycosyltransferase family 2 protein [Rhodococcus sp. Z13]UYP19942.1 glycosyltransferase [Rhodococcus sp. Z13]
MESDRLRVSVVVPVYRSLPYVEKCLGSVLRQTRPVDQIVLVDDRGGDESMDAATGFLDERGVAYTTVVHPRNLGLGRARNSGLRSATGDLVWFLDSDDEAEPQFVETLVAALEDADADFACCRTLRVDEHDRPLQIDEEPVRESVVSGVDFAHELIRGRVKSYACTKLFRREILGDRPWDEGQAYEDFASVLRIALDAKRVAMVDDPLYRYLFREGSISNALGESTFDLFKVGRDARAAVRRHGLDREWLDDMRGFHYRQVLTSVAHLAMRARHASTDRPGLYDTAIRKVRSEISLSDTVPLVRSGYRREAVFAVLVKTAPWLYSAILRHR